MQVEQDQAGLGGDSLGAGQLRQRLETHPILRSPLGQRGAECPDGRVVFGAAEEDLGRVQWSAAQQAAEQEPVTHP
ncbi:hypothetical protein D3C84_1125740 [compost metagenome]